MEITVQQAYLTHKVLTDKLKELESEKFPFIAFYRLTAILEALSPIVKRYEETKNKLIIEKYGAEKEGEPGNYEVKPENKEVFYEDINKLFSEKEEITVKKIKLEDISSIKMDITFSSVLSQFVEE